MATTWNDVSAKNPYTQENRAEYKMGVFEDFFHNLGFRTNVDQYNEDMDNRAKEWEAQATTARREEEYNSEVAQAQRQREAGLNPDLNGVETGTATEMTEPEHNAVPGENDMEALGKAGEHAARLGTALIGILNGGAAAVGTIANVGISLGNFGLEQEDKQYRNKENLLEMVTKAHEYYSSLKGNENGLSYANGAKIAADMGLKGRQYGEFSKLYDDLYTSTPNLVQASGNKLAYESNQYNDWLIGKTKEIQEITLQTAMHDAEMDLKFAEERTKILNEQPDWVEAVIQGEYTEALTEEQEAHVAAIQSQIDKKRKEFELERLEKDIEILKNYESDTKHSIFEWFKKRPAEKRFYGQNYDNSDMVETGTKAALGIAGLGIGGKAVFKIGKHRRKSNWARNATDGMNYYE